MWPVGLPVLSNGAVALNRAWVRCVSSFVRLLGPWLLGPGCGRCEPELWGRGGVMARRPRMQRCSEVASTSSGCVCHMQVHEEVLRLLLAAAPLLKSQELGEYLGLTLENSKRSRKRISKKQRHGGLDPMAEFPMAIASDIGSDIGSDGWPGILNLKLSASDGVRSVYNQFARVRDINDTTAPALFAYLAEGAQQQQQGPPGPDTPAADAPSSQQAPAAGDGGAGEGG